MENLVTLYTRPDKRIGPPLDFMGMLDTARALCNSLDHVTHKAVRDTVLLTLVVNPIRNAVHDTLRHSLYEDDALRRQVLVALRHMPEAIGLFIESFNADEDGLVRQFAVDVFEEFSGA